MLSFSSLLVRVDQSWKSSWKIWFCRSHVSQINISSSHNPPFGTMKTQHPVSTTNKSEVIGVLVAESFPGNFEQSNENSLTRKEGIYISDFIWICTLWGILFSHWATGLSVLRLVFVLQDNEGQTALHYGKKASFINLGKCLKKCTMYFLFSAINLFVSVCLYFKWWIFHFGTKASTFTIHWHHYVVCVCALFIYSTLFSVHTLSLPTFVSNLSSLPPLPRTLCPPFLMFIFYSFFHPVSFIPLCCILWVHASVCPLVCMCGCLSGFVLRV